ncbi:PHB2 [Cordylochernes scorpioides]|uniref:PHB2 n=1 Tax=Cordylochernes scorpioides TaxID=51811 RepID=A0ABY6JWL4_9ARAC|nr:PHB2 [Cordylochernes scorpioides]
MKRHLKLHQDIQELDTCDFCQKSFTQKGHLRRHLTRRTKEKVCPVCYKTFFDAYTMKRHFKTHLEVQELYTCPQCRRGFTQIGSLYRHQAKFCKVSRTLYHTKNAGYLKLRKIRAAQNIAKTIANSQNRVYLDAGTLMLNIAQKDFDITSIIGPSK